ncbi:hypothetical protein [Streptomyces sp. NPDC058739]|uniref:hypothetical protein n=1 Tax=Streptomyces sp. NPDC058739 TaxID=3346618 RepID=UPI003676B173
MTGRDAAGLAYACAHYEELREVLGDDGTDPSTPLARLRAACGGERGEIVGVLGEVDAALRAATGGFVSIHGVGESRPGQLSGLEPLEHVFRCPLRQCTGRHGSEVAEARPVCSLSRRELIRERLA